MEAEVYEGGHFGTQKLKAILTLGVDIYLAADTRICCRPSLLADWVPTENSCTISPKFFKWHHAEKGVVSSAPLRDSIYTRPAVHATHK